MTNNFKVTMLMLVVYVLTYMFTYKLAYDDAVVELDKIIEVSKSIGYLTCMQDINNNSNSKIEIKL